MKNCMRCSLKSRRAILKHSAEQKLSLDKRLPDITGSSFREAWKKNDKKGNSQK